MSYYDHASFMAYRLGHWSADPTSAHEHSARRPIAGRTRNHLKTLMGLMMAFSL